MIIIEKVEKFYLEEIEKCRLADLHKEHIKEFSRLAKIAIKKFPEADEEVVYLSVWLHDIGLAREMNKETEDHAVIGEAMAKKWLAEEKYNKEKIKKILHCVRAHRCKDIQPETLEARLIAFTDSASHITQGVYLNILKEERDNLTNYDPLMKLERDWRDLAFFPEMREEFTDLYEAWKKIIESYRKINKFI